MRSSKKDVIMEEKPMTLDEFRRKGGKARVAKAGDEEMKKVQSKGGNTTKERYGSEHFKRIRQIGVEKSKQRKLAENKP